MGDKRMMVRVGGFALALLGAAFSTAAMAQEPAKVDASTVVVTVNGAEVTLGHLAALRDQLPAQYQQLPDDVLLSGLLDQVIQQTALAQAGEKLVTKKDELSLENDRRAYLAGLSLQAAVESAVTEDALKAAYDKKYKGVDLGKEYKAAHILVESEDLIKEIKAKIDAGEDFAELARAHSMDGSAQGGGDLGWFGLGTMVKPFEDAVVALEDGKVSEPLQTQFGWHLVKLEETRVATAPAFEAVQAELIAELEQSTVEAAIEAATKDANVIRTEGIDLSAIKSDTLFQD